MLVLLAKSLLTAMMLATTFSAACAGSERHHAENISVEFQALERSSATTWDARWTEHIRSPAGVALRTEHYAGELVASATPAGFEVKAFRVQSVDDASGARQ